VHNAYAVFDKLIVEWGSKEKGGAEEPQQKAIEHCGITRCRYKYLKLENK